jgi:excisionase family DNA binding protein
MTDHVIIPLPGIGSLRLPADIYQQYLQPIAATQNLTTPSEQAPQLLDAKDTAQRFSVPKSWLLERARNGSIPSQRIGRYVRFNAAELAAHLVAVSQPVGRR